MAKPRQRGAKQWKWRAPAIRRRGPQALQHLLLGITETLDIPRPESYLGTRVDGPSLRKIIGAPNEAEWRPFWALISLGLMPDWPEGFEYQASVAGGHVLGGNAPDFLMPGLDLAVGIQGLHWHFKTTAVRGSDNMVAIKLASIGIKYIRVDEADAMTRPRAVMAAALRGEDWSLATRGQA